MKRKTTRKRAEKPMNLPNPLLVDESELTDLVRKMVNTGPVTRKEVEGRRLRKNPETDPRYLPVFDFRERIRISPGEQEHIAESDRLNREFKKKR